MSLQACMLFKITQRWLSCLVIYLFCMQDIARPLKNMNFVAESFQKIRLVIHGFRIFRKYLNQYVLLKLRIWLF